MQRDGVLAIVEALRNTRDTDTNLHGLNQLRRAIRSSDGLAFLQEYLSHTQGFDELQNIWDAQLTVQNYHVTVTLLLALSDILILATSPEAQQQQAQQPPPQQQSLHEAAAALAKGVLSRRLKALYFNLSSEIRGKSNAALCLLAALARQGASTTRELARLFDFSLAALPSLARPPRQRSAGAEGAEGGASSAPRLWALWRGGDELKRPTRAGFVAFALALLQQADPLTLCTLLATRPLTAGLLNSLAGDPPEVQLLVLRVLRSRVLSSKAGVSAATQAEVLSEAVLSQLSQIAANSAADGDMAAEDEGAGGEEAKQAQQAADLAFRTLMEIATDPAHGLCAAEGEVADTLAGAVGAQLSSGQRRLLRGLQRLRPSDSAAHLELLTACTARDPALAVALLLSLPFSLEPSATGRFLAHAAVTGALMQQAGALQVGLSRCARVPAADSKVMLGLLRCAVPSCLSKAALSRGVQHSSALVRHATLCLLAAALDMAGVLLRDIAAAGDAAGASGAERERWRELGRAVQGGVRAGLPDPQPVLALFHLLEKGGRREAASAGSGEMEGKARRGREEGEDEDGTEAVLNIVGAPVSEPQRQEGREGEEEEQRARKELEGGRGSAAGQGEAGAVAGAAEARGLAGANPALVSAVLRVLVGWQRALPGALAEAHVDAERLLPQDLLQLQPQHQYLFMELLLAQQAQQDTASSRAVDTPAGAPGAQPLPAAPLLPVLHLLCGAQHAEVRGPAWRWAQGRLAATGAFSGGGGSAGSQGEARLWLEHLPRAPSDPSAPAVCSFLCEALMQLQRRPHEFFELAQQARQAHGTSDSQCSSLLALCALRQALRVLPSSKMPSSDKAAICAYVAAALGTLLRRQHGIAQHSMQGMGLGGVPINMGQAEEGLVSSWAPGAAARSFAWSLLGVLRSEVQRGAQQGAGGNANGEGHKKRRKGEADGAAPAAGEAGANGQAAAVLTLPVEGQCLASLALLLEQEAGVFSRETLLAASDATGVEQPAKKKRKKSKGVEEAGQEPAPSSFYVASPSPGSGEGAGSLLDETLLGQLAQQGQQAQRAAWELRRRLLCLPRVQAAGAVQVLASERTGEEAADLIVDVCLAHNLPLPLGEALPLTRSAVPSPLPGAAGPLLLDSPPTSLLLHSLVAISPCPASDAAEGREAGAGPASRGGLAAAASLLAAVGRRVAGAEGEEGEEALAVVGQCLYWLEKAACGQQVQLLFQAMQCALSLPAASPHVSRSLGLVAAHPLVQSALAFDPPAEALVADVELASEVRSAIAFSAVELLRRQLGSARGGELAARRAAGAQLLHMAAAAFLQQAAAAAAAATAATTGAALAEGVDGLLASNSKHKLKSKKKSKRSAAGAAGAAAESDSGSSQEMTTAASHWAALLPWMGAAEVEGALRALLGMLSQDVAPQDIPSGTSEEAGKSWVVDVTVGTLGQLLSGGSAMAPGLLSSGCAALARLAASWQTRQLDECLLKLLSGPHAQLALACLDVPSTQQRRGDPASAPLLQACLDRPSPARACVAKALVECSPAARARFAGALPRLLPPKLGGSGGGAGGAEEGKGVGGEDARRALVACALPPAAALMQLALQARAAARDGGAAAGGNNAEEGSLWVQAAEVAGCLRGPLLSFLTSKRQPGPSPSPEAPVAAAELAGLLHAHALPCLRLCLLLHPLSGEERGRLLPRLLPSAGWPADAVSLDSTAAGGGGWAASPAQKAQAALALLELRGSREAGQEGPPLLLRYLQTYAATLAALFKVSTPTPGQAQFEGLLIRQLDGPLGDSVAGLPAEQRNTEAFARLAEAACGLGTAVLRHRFGDVTVLRTLRRFMAALLPDDSEGEEEQEGGAAAAGDQSSRPGRPGRGGMGSGRRSSREGRGGDTGSSGGGSESSSGEEGGSSSSSSEEESSGGSDSSDSEGDSEESGLGPAGGSAARRAKQAKQDGGGAALLRNPPVAAAAMALLQRVMTHSLFVAVLRAAGASPLPLPPSVQALPRPLQSLVPLAELPASQLTAAAAALPVHGGKLGAEGEAALLKKELCELLETLLDLQEQFAPEGAPTPQELQQAQTALLPLLMAGYGASLSATDRAVWSLAQAVNLRLWQQAQQAQRGAGAGGMDVDSESEHSVGSGDEGGEEGLGEREAVAALLHGPLYQTGFAWGAAATALQASGLFQCGSGGGSGAGGGVSGEKEEERKKLLQSKVALDPLRCALSAVHFPEWRGLAGQQQGAGAPDDYFIMGGAYGNSDSEASPAAAAAAVNATGGASSPGDAGLLLPAGQGLASLSSGAQADQPPASFHPASSHAGPPALPYAEAGYDPAFLLPLCVAALRQRLLPVLGLVQSGALSLCLRALAAADAGLRGLAYEAVALFREQLEGEEFREKRQLSTLLGTLQNALTSPFQRLPAIHALFCAEAALVVTHPGAPMFPPVNKCLLKRAVLDLQEVPLFGQLMLGGSPSHAAERHWLLQLLIGGLRGPEDARLYRRRYVLELAMSLFDSSVVDPRTAQLALTLVCRATYIPRAARQLVDHSGLIPWLAAAAARALRSQGAPAFNGQGPGPASSLRIAAAAVAAPQWATEALSALLRLTSIRAVARPGAKEVLDDLAYAAQHLLAVLKAPGDSTHDGLLTAGGSALRAGEGLPGGSRRGAAGAAAAREVWAQAQQLLRAVQVIRGGSSSSSKKLDVDL